MYTCTGEDLRGSESPRTKRQVSFDKSKMPKSRAPSDTCLGVDGDGKPCPVHAQSKYTLLLDGRKYYFSSTKCRNAWLALHSPHFAVAAAPQIAASKAKFNGYAKMYYHQDP